jgi:Xaa-Pro dipeptidase
MVLMPTRRRLLKSAAALSPLPLLSRNALAAEPAHNLPPSIAALKSMRGQARPITTSERERRLERARELMRENKIDALFLAGGTSLSYFTGVRWGNSERLFATVVPVTGKSFCICPSFEEGRAREQLNMGPLESADVLTWHEDESPYRLLAVGLQNAKIATGTLGVEERTPFVFADGLAQASPGIKIASATPVTAGCRMIKSEHELELMKIANAATLAVYDAVFRALSPGMTAEQASGLISDAYGQVGFRGFASFEVGASSALPHGSVAAQVIREGTPVIVDDGCTVEGYQSDISRTFVLCKASDRAKKVFEIVHRAQRAALDTARPGMDCQAVDAAARKVIEDASFGPDYKFFSHRVGHGIGMDGHEWPYLVRGNTLALAPGMTFSDEPGVYIPGEFGVRLEDDMYITRDGAQLFTPQSPDIEHPFG